MCITAEKSGTKWSFEGRKNSKDSDITDKTVQMLDVSNQIYCISEQILIVDSCFYLLIENVSNFSLVLEL